jgi:hypothetical protein
MAGHKVILRFMDGNLIRGYIADLSPLDDFVSVEEDGLSESQTIAIDELKAIFFVKTFEGNSSHSEKKSFLTIPAPGKKIFVRFKDGESMTGYLEGDFPWEKGFFLDPKKTNGFFLRPVDAESNNLKVFVVAASVSDVTSVR